MYLEAGEAATFTASEVSEILYLGLPSLELIKVLRSNAREQAGAAALATSRRNLG